MMCQSLEIVLLHILCLITVSYSVNPACECLTFSSEGRSSGTFTSPNYPQFYPKGINCILYTFLGDVGEIVEISFFEFDLQLPIINKCTDFVRVFLDLPRPEVNERDTWNYEMCGDIRMIQKVHYSSHRPLILEFHTDNIQGNHTGFRGTFNFIEKARFETVGGSKRWGSKCTYDFYSGANTKSGRFFSPKYPQNYPPNHDCQYIFYGSQQERVKIIFQNIQLETIDGSCTDSPDRIVVRDGQNRSAPMTAQYCNTHNNVEVISSGEVLYIELDVDEKKQRQGFAATFEFVHEEDLIRKVEPVYPPGPNHGVNTHNPGDDPGHIVPTVPTPRGSHSCTETFNSAVSKQGTFRSPGYPAPYDPDLRCRYVFQGHGKERVQIKFADIDLNVNQAPRHSNKCRVEKNDAILVSVRLDGDKQAIGRFCHGTPYHQLMSSDNYLEVDFFSHSTSATGAIGFSATYSFVTDFGIKTGLQNPDRVCGFKFHSYRYPNGTFTSPNYPGIYPRNTECTYEFYGNASEIVDITFQFFDVEGMPPKCDDGSQSDYIEFSNFDIPDRKMVRYCGKQEQGRWQKVKSDGPFFQVLFNSNNVFDRHGFQAVFQFRRKEGSSEKPVSRPQGNSATLIATHALSWTITLIIATLIS